MPTTNEQYIDLRAKFQSASDRLEETTQIIKRVGSALERGTFSFTKTDVALSADTIPDDEKSTVRVDEWPHAGAIICIQKAKCDARANLLNFYNTLPETERKAMIPLPPGVQTG